MISLITGSKLCIPDLEFAFLLLLQLSHPEKVDGLTLINCTSERAGWTEWGYQKVIVVQLD